MLYTMKNDFLNVEISDKGAEIKSIKLNNIDYLHNSDPKYWGYSAPILFPNIGTLKNNQTIFDGVSYPLTKHGFVRTSLFKVVEHTPTCMTLLLEDNEETLKLYPFHFKMYVEYYLDHFKVRGSIRIINNSSTIMPFNLGLHPAFKVPLLDNEAFSDYHIIFDKVATYETPTVDLKTGLLDWKNRDKELINLEKLPLNYDDYKVDAIVLENIKTNTVVLEHQNNHHGVKVEFPNFTHLGIWTPNHIKAPFICLEPWIGCGDSPTSDGIFNHKRDIINLKPNEEYEANYVYSFF